MHIGYALLLTARGRRPGLAIGSAIVRGTRGEWLVGASPLGGARIGVSWPQA